MTHGNLDPWRVILHHLFYLHSRDIPHIIDRTGLAVDWSLTEKEAYSNNTRLAAYRPRINVAYEKLNEDDKLRVSYIVVSALKDIGADELDRDLEHIGWKIESGRLLPQSAEISELFFPTGTQHDAYVELRRIVQQAQHEISIIDPHVDGTIFKLLTNLPESVSNIRILTYKLPPDFLHEARKFQSQYSKVTLQIRSTKEFHDRFIVLDNNDCWHIGCSIKDAGVRAFMIGQIEDQENRKSLVELLRTSWEKAPDGFDK